jgi:hypothetical protein
MAAPQATSAIGVSHSTARYAAGSSAETPVQLKPRRALLVLDNREHLLEACAQLAYILLSACPRLREALEVCEQLGDRRGVARSLTLLGSTTYLAADLVAARSLHEQGVALSREIGNHWGTGWALNNLGEDLLTLREFGQDSSNSADRCAGALVPGW